MSRGLHALAGVLASGVAFAAGCAPQPAVTVTPASGLVDGQEVTVRGSGYTGGASVGIVQCRAGATAIDQCDSRTADSFSTDATGSYRQTMVVYAVIEDAHGIETDCGAAAGACEVASVYIHGFEGLATAPLTFAP